MSSEKESPSKAEMTSHGKGTGTSGTQGQRYSLDPDELKDQVIIHTFRASGPGGQHRNVTDSGVRIVHKLSGVVVTATESRSQLRNKEKAFERLISRLTKLNYIAKRRIPTKKTRTARGRELDEKHRHQEKKKLRERPDMND